MIDLCMKFWEMAWEGSIVLLAIMLIRFILKKVPKKYMCFLWMIALLRLCVPYLPQGPIPAFWRSTEMNTLSEGRKPYGEVSVVQERQLGYSGNKNAAEQLAYSGNKNATEQLAHGENVNTTEQLDYVTNTNEEGQVLNSNKTSDTTLYVGQKEMEHGRGALFSIVFGIVWLLGAMVALARFGLQYLRISSRLQESVPVEKFQNCLVKEHPLPGLPAVLGVVHPCIYVPINFSAWEEKQRELILLHEATHIRRGDHILKLFSIFVLCMYWWNPVVWMGVKLLHCDIEMACDEGVLASQAEDSREVYAKVLLFHAVRNKQMALPIAFGENQTEGRIKNILRYRKTSIVVSAALILLVGILVICIGTKPRDVMAEETTREADIEMAEETQELSSSNLVEAETTHAEKPQDWWTQCENYWTERLVAEGKVKNPDEEIFSFQDCVRMPGEEYGLGSRVSLQVVVVDEAGNTSLYQSVADLPKPIDVNQPSEVPNDIENTVHEEIGEIDQKDVILKLSNIYFSDYVSVGEQDEIEKFFVVIANRMKEKAPGNYQLLGEPESAAELLLHLKGSAEAFVYNQYNSGLLKYNLADGEQIILLMVNNEDVWYPYEILNAEWERNESQKEIDYNLFSEYETENTYLTEVTADTLRKVKNSAEGGNVRSEWYDHLENNFIIISQPKNEEAKKVDATLYGMYGGNSMVLRVGEKAFPIRIYWPSPQMILPELYCGDYDGDGDMEYVIKTRYKTGTGISGDEIHMVEIQGDTYKMNTFDDLSQLRQLERINYTYDEKHRIITMWDDNGKDTSVSIGQLLDEYGEEGSPSIFKQIVFGDIDSFFLQDNCWYYSAVGGIKTEDFSQPQYDISVKMTCPVIYNESEGFTFGKMQFRIGEYEE